MKKVIVIALLTAAVILIAFILFFSGVLSFETMGSDRIPKKEITAVSDLEDGAYYVLHKESGKEIFRLCPAGKKNWDGEDSLVAHTLWFNTQNDTEIPVLYPDDQLIFVSSASVPYEGIQWERFADYGYSIGVANLESDQGGHFFIRNTDDGYTAYINPDSDAVSLASFVTVSELFIDKLGGAGVGKELVSEGGTLYGLNKDEKYICEWYSGTYFQDYEMTANTHVFCSLESFTTYDYEFLHSNCIAITIPEWLKTGCYYVDGIGLFRYVAQKDVEKYNGTPFDPNINWNDKMILYDENGFLKYDPTTGYKAEESDISDDRNETEKNDSDIGAEEYEN